MGTDWYNPCTSDAECIPELDCLVGTCNSGTCVYEPENGVEYELRVLTDMYPQDTYWRIYDESKDDNQVVIARGAYYTDEKTLYKHNIMLCDVNNKLCTYDGDRNDGLCCNNGDGYYKLLYNDSVIVQGGDFTGNSECQAFNKATPP